MPSTTDLAPSSDVASSRNGSTKVYETVPGGAEKERLSDRVLKEVQSFLLSVGGQEDLEQKSSEQEVGLAAGLCGRRPQKVARKLSGCYLNPQARTLYLYEKDPEAFEAARSRFEGSLFFGRTRLIQERISRSSRAPLGSEFLTWISVEASAKR